MPIATGAVVIATFNDPLEAAMARGALQSAGIEAELRDAAMTALQLGNAVGGAKLVVAAADEERARSLLAQLELESAGDEPPELLH